MDTHDIDRVFKDFLGQVSEGEREAPKENLYAYFTLAIELAGGDRSRSVPEGCP